MKELSIPAQCAKAIRKELKESFPNIKFQVRSDSFAGGSSVDINYEDGVIEDDIVKIVGKYEYGRFDGMTDMYEITNSREDIPQVKYVMVNRKMSDSKSLEIKNRLASFFGIKEIDNEEEWRNKTGNWSNCSIRKEFNMNNY